MMEKLYKTMELTGACNIAVGIVTMTIGVTAGVLSIVAGSILLRKKNDLLL